MKRVVPLAGVIVVMVAACGDNRSPAVDAPPVPPVDAADIDAPMPDANPLATLQGTGLCLDAACANISPDVHEYRPRFQLWADTATKRRWMQLPAGTKIDTTDMNHWVFPVGTKFWKEFTRDGTRVETRFITKTLADDDAPGAWFFVTYAWNASQDEAVATIMGQPDANGTNHDIPARSACKECHESLRPSRVLGFQAFQLDFDSPLMDLEDLIAGDLLTAPPTTGTAGARFPLAGFSQVEKEALGYLHANCGHCHNPTSPTHDITTLDVAVDVTKLASMAATPAFLTTVDHAADVPFTEMGTTYKTIIVSHDVANSGLMVRMNIADLQSNRRMPKLGSEMVDPDGQTALVAWIQSL